METIKVDFSKLRVEVAISVFKSIDVRHEVGNALHVGAVTIPISDLAKQIYYSEGPVEIKQDYLPEFMEIISRSFKIVMIKALQQEIDKQLNNKED